MKEKKKREGMKERRKKIRKEGKTEGRKEMWEKYRFEKLRFCLYNWE